MRPLLHRHRTTSLIAARTLTLLLLTALTLAAQTPQIARPTTRIVSPIDVTRRTTLHGNVHPLATPSNDRGPVDDATPMRRMILTLAPSAVQQQALESLLSAQQDKNSPEFHHWLTPSEFGAQFGISGADLQTVTQWLTSQGFTIDNISAGRTTLQFSGTAGQVRQAFATAIHHYLVNGTLYQANATDPSIPSALAPVVRGVVSLYNFPRHPHHILVGNFRRDNSTGKLTALPGTQSTTAANTTRPHPNFTYPDPNLGTVYAVSPYDFATIYNLAPLWNQGIDGTGQTIAIVGETNIHLDDIRAFRSLFNLPARDPEIILNGVDPGITSAGEEGEALIDNSWSGAVAKNATIRFVVSASTEASQGVDLSALYIIDNDVAPIMSTSYGECELGLGTAGNAFYNALYQQGAAEGISIFISTGDNGAAACDNPDGTTAAEYGPAVSGLASTPYNTAVGGTDLLGSILAPSTYWGSNNPTTQASALSYIPETTWNDTCANPLFQLSAFFNQSNAAAACQYAYNHGDDFFVPIGGSGGESACTTSTNGELASCAGGYPKPSWQTGPGVPADGHRDIPDVSLFASNGFLGSFYVYCQQDLDTDGESCNINSPYADIQGVGGTSVSTPAFAGIMALVNQKTGQRQGLANPVLYSLFNQQVSAGTACSSGYNTSSNSLVTPSSACIFNDLTYGSNSVPCIVGSTDCTRTGTDHYGIITLNGTQTWPDTTGYDLASGLGSVNALNLINNWSNVSLLPTATTLSLSSTTFPHGASVSATISVAPTSGAGTPTGSVSLQTSTVPTSLGALTLSNGAVTGSYNDLPGGTYTVSAHYAGDSTYAASDSTPISVTVTPENSSTTQAVYRVNQNTGAVAAVTTSPYGSEIDLATTVTPASGHGVPTGSVAIKDSVTLLGSTALDTNGQAHTFPTTLAVASHSFTATYSGDASFNASSTATASALTITAAPTTTTLTTSANTIAAGASITLTAVIVGANSTAIGNFGAAPTGTVSFYSGGTAGTLLGTAPISSIATNTNGYLTGTASFTTANLPYSTTANTNDSITAVYSGDANYSTSTSTAHTVTVTPSTRTTTTSSLTANPSGLTYGGSVTFTGTVSSSSGTPTGTVQFYVDGAATGSAQTLTAGAAGLTVTTLTGGSHLITAIYSGSATYLGSSAALQYTVAPASLNLSLSASTTTALQGASILFTATIPYTTPAKPTGAIIFSVDGSPTGPGIAVGPFNIGGLGAYFTDNQLPSGSHTILAAYSGDTNYAPASASLTVTISAAPFLALWLANTGPFPVSSTLTVDAKASTLSAGPIPTGSVSYTLDGLAESSSPLSLGAASFAIPGYKLLKYPIVGLYSGDANYASLTQSLQVNQFEQTILFRGLANIPYTPGKTLALTARATSGLPVTYTVTGPATLSGSTLTLTGPGAITITASQSGNATFTAAPSVNRSFTSQ